MKPFHIIVLAFGLAALAPTVADATAAETPEKLNAYVGCINRLSARAYDSRARYFSWAAKSGPTGRERIIYGTYTIYDTSDCRKNVVKANALEPHDAALEAAATAYADAVGKLEPLLKEADDYYTAGKLQGRPDGQGQSPASASGRRVGRIRGRRPEPAQQRRSHQRQTRSGETRRDRARRRPQGALLRRGADDPGQARAARAGHRQTRPRRNRAGAERVRRHRQGGRTGFGRRRRRARSARYSSAAPSRSWSLRSS